MRTYILLFLSIISFFPGFGQVGEPARDLLKQGIALHDQKDYEGAIKLYDEVLRKDPNSFLAHYEKSLSLYTWGKYEECINLCKTIIRQFPKEDQTRQAYVNYGSSLDALGKPGEAISIYSEGIKKFPGSYLLYFNRGVTHSMQKDMDKATEDFQQSVSLNPSHASSHQYLAYCVYDKNKIASAMALTAFLAIEPQGKRAEKNLKLLQQLLGSNVEQKDEKNITITLSADALDPKGRKVDDFSHIELLMSMTSALALSKEKKDKSAVEKFQDKLEVIALITPDKKKSRHGFFTKFYLPFFKQIRADSSLGTLSYIAYLSSNDEEAKDWVQTNKTKVDEFYNWLGNYDWIKKD